jgi:hypothetical protein
MSLHIINTNDKPRNNAWSRGGKFKPIKPKIPVVTVDYYTLAEFQNDVCFAHPDCYIEFTGNKANVLPQTGRRTPIARYRVIINKQ